MAVFSGHCIPDYMFTDQGRQFTSAEFQEFARYYQLEIVNSRPRYPQSNGFIEAMVKFVKYTMSKTEQSGQDPDLVVLAYRVTPRGPHKLSPAEARTQQKYRALVPSKQHLSAQLATSREIMLQQKWQQTEHYNYTKQQLQKLQQEQPA